MLLPLWCLTAVRYTYCVERRIKVSYKDLSNLYLIQASTLNNHIKFLKKQLSKLSTSETKDIHRRISLLYPMYLDLKHTGRYLQNMEVRETYVK